MTPVEGVVVAFGAIVLFCLLKITYDVEAIKEHLTLHDDDEDDSDDV